MEIKEIQNIYATHPNLKALSAKLNDSSVNTLFLAGLHASAASAFFSSYLKNTPQTLVFVLNDLEEAGYFYHDLVQINGEETYFFSRLPIVVPLNTDKKMQLMKSYVLRCLVAFRRKSNYVL